MAKAYDVQQIDRKWQKRWQESRLYQVELDREKPKYYVLDMFPYPSGSGLHVGHPLGYIASDIFARYKRLQGCNVLHPMGFDAFGLPAEQYAIKTGQHPAKTTQDNVKRYREQLERIGLGYDWNRSFCTCDPEYYKWTQWVFLQLFNHYYDTEKQQARPIHELEEYFAKYGTKDAPAYGLEDRSLTAEEWHSWTCAPKESFLYKAKEELLQSVRLAYRSEMMVNWCPDLGTVLANDEVKDGLSVRGGHPVMQRMMQQWCLRVSAYAERLLAGLETIDWSDSLKQMQRNWIGKSVGASIRFSVTAQEIQSFDSTPPEIEVFTTRPDTIYGVTFLVLAPEHPLLQQLTTAEHAKEMQDYLEEVSRRSERERLTEVKRVSGVFTGSYAEHPLQKGTRVPIWVSDYVLSSYGTGAIMAVPAHDSRDFAFARHFNLPIIQVVSDKRGEKSEVANWTEAYELKDGFSVNSNGFNDLPTVEALPKFIEMIARKGVGEAKTTYRLRDAVFSRQRYWGEPIPIHYDSAGVPCPLDEKLLPLELPEVDKYLPTEDGEPPLARAEKWRNADGHPLETCTMPGFAGSSAYYLRYMDPRNEKALVSKEAVEYWRSVDLYVGGAEHATGHLIYSRFWNKFLFDLGYVVEEEPFKKLVNQGMILGRSSFVYRLKGENRYIPVTQIKGKEVTPIYVDIHCVEAGDILNIERLKSDYPEFRDAEFVLEEGKYKCGWATEKMSKSFLNVENPDSIVESWGADSFRMYEMFLGPLELSKPWGDQSGIEGVYRFLRRLWNLYQNATFSEGEASEDVERIIQRTIKKVGEDISRLSFNTCVSAFMVCLNELNEHKCDNRNVLERLLIILSPFAPHTCEELWEHMGHSSSIFLASWPSFEQVIIEEQDFECPVSFNGKTRFTLRMPQNLSKQELHDRVMAATETQNYLAGRDIIKVIAVPGKIVNIVFKA